MAFSIPRLTPEGRAALEAELASLEQQQLPEIAERIALARDGGIDPTENLDLRDATEELTLLENRAMQLRSLLASAELLEPTPIRDGIARIGAQVRVRHADGEEASYRLVSAAEAQPRAGRISIDSPIGSALVGQASGCEIVALTPAGPERLMLLDVA